MYFPAYVSIRQHTSTYVSIRQTLLEDAENIKALLRLYYGPITALLRLSIPAGVAAVAEDDAVYCLCSGAVSIRQQGGGQSPRAAMCVGLGHISAGLLRVLSAGSPAQLSIRQHTSANVSIRRVLSAGSPAQSRTASKL